jgi:hypothetical protein
MVLHRAGSARSWLAARSAVEPMELLATRERMRLLDPLH